MKQCSKCGRELLLSEFYKDRARKDGLAYRCRDCCRAYRATIEYRTAQKKYRQSLKGKASNARYGKRYRRTKKGKTAHVRAVKKYQIKRKK